MANTIVIKNKDRRLRNNSLQFFALTVHYKQPSDKTAEVSPKSHSKHKKLSRNMDFTLLKDSALYALYHYTQAWSIRLSGDFNFTLSRSFRLNTSEL